MAGPKDRRSARHRAAPASGPEEQPDLELESYLKALAPKQDDPDSELTGRFGSTQVFQLRLPAMYVDQLRKIAEERVIAPAALAGDWVVERLQREDPPTGPLRVIRPPDEDDEGDLGGMKRSEPAKGSQRRAWPGRRDR